MDMDTTLTLILSELKGINQRMYSMETKMTSMDNHIDSMENKITSIETRIDSMENKMISIETRIDSMENKMTSIETRIDRLERGQDEIKSNLADLTEQVKENTLFIRALVDGQTVLETKLSTLDKGFLQLSNRTKKLERTSGGILYELAIREDDLC